MKPKFTKKLLSGLLAVALLLTLLPALSLGANADSTETVLFSCTFDSDDDIGGWEFGDKDGDGSIWHMYDDDEIDFYPVLRSDSYDNDGGPLTPDNWAYTPYIDVPGTDITELTYQVFAQDPDWYSEHYSVYVCRDGLDDVLLLEETLKEGEDRNTPAQRTLSLNQFAGECIRIAFRHHDVSDQFAICIDNIQVKNQPYSVIRQVSVLTDEPVADAEVRDLGELAPGQTGYTVASVSWEPVHETFRVGTEYSVCVSLEAEDGFAFAEDVSARINGLDADVIYVGMDSMKIAYTFPKLEAPLPAMFFEDVRPSDWFYSDVEYVYYNRLMNGVSANLFKPKSPTDRAMVVTILYRMEGSPVVSDPCPFTDVPAGSYYEKAVTWAAQNGIVNGVGGGRFNPKGQIKREQMAAIFCRYAEYLGTFQESDCAMLAGFADCGKVSDWAELSMSWAVGKGIITGISGTDGLYLRPADSTQRCQTAAILRRFCEG